jgi:hypothetical protein
MLPGKSVADEMASGVTLTAVEALLGPIMFVATTVHDHVVPLVNPVTVRGLPAPLAVRLVEPAVQVAA